MKIGLLDYLAYKTGCVCLSDLSSRDLIYRVQYILRGIEPGDFEVKEWNEAITYITGEEASFSEKEQAAAYLQGYQF